MDMEFVVVVPWHGIWMAKITQERDGSHLDISLEQAASLELYP
jgi:hypothetical protein